MHKVKQGFEILFAFYFSYILKNILCLYLELVLSFCYSFMLVRQLRFLEKS